MKYKYIKFVDLILYFDQRTYMDGMIKTTTYQAERLININYIISLDYEYNLIYIQEIGKCRISSEDMNRLKKILFDV